jgi:hypothetical protein
MESEKDETRLGEPMIKVGLQLDLCSQISMIRVRLVAALVSLVSCTPSRLHDIWSLKGRPTLRQSGAIVAKN